MTSRPGSDHLNSRGGSGQHLLAVNLCRVQPSLERSFPPLEALGKNGPADDTR
jgi:hypothetical protein